ncbi:unnamed protein product [Nezara viridula]|uniref:Transmembrane protein n=1 Tax=Nezara viridula TaxID=85310 RepID=A0A9P0MY54_NEZVI|nr:unnamed protein product [Nezara viridula]
MSHCRCRTINLAVVSVEKLKQMESKVQKVPVKKKDYDTLRCPPYPPMPAPPGPVSTKKIMVCSIKPMEFQAPPVPCVCPPCPPCKTYAERSAELLKTGMKLFVMYLAARWTIDNKIWGDHKGTTDFMLSFLESNFPSKGTLTQLPDLGLVKYKLLHGWDLLIGNLFYYTFGLPLKIFAQLMSKPAEEEEPIDCVEMAYTPISDLMSLDNPVFRAYIFYNSILILKMLCMAPLTARLRMAKKIFITPEDTTMFKGAKHGVEDPDIERVRRREKTLRKNWDEELKKIFDRRDLEWNSNQERKQ